MSQQYWLVSLPLSAPGCSGRRDGAWRVLQERTSGTSQLSSNAKLEVPESLRVGTIDSLMAQSDELARVCQSVDAVVGKIRRTVAESAASAPGAGSSSSSHHPPGGPLRIEGQPPEQFLQRFRWDEAKYPTRRPLRETVERIAEAVSSVEDDLKVRLAELNAVRGLLSQASRKATGSLAVRDLQGVVDPSKGHLVDTDNLCTAFVVLPRHALREWESSYETLASLVVPRSSAVLAEDGESALVRCVLFRRCADFIKSALVFFIAAMREI
jgi:V-type H+-transporting ATPase subunit C